MKAATKKANGRRDNNTGSIYKDGTGYRVQVQIGNDPTTGKPLVRKVRAASHDEAVKALARLQNAHFTGKLTEATGTNLEAFLTQWLEHSIKPNRAPKNGLRAFWKWIKAQGTRLNLLRM